VNKKSEAKIIWYANTEYCAMGLMTLSKKFAVLGVVLLGLSACASNASGPVPGSIEDLVVNVGDRVFYDFDQYNLKPSSQATLDRQAAWLNQYSGVTVLIEGHCDERGTREYNLALGARRANAAKDYLLGAGVDAGRIQTISYGKDRPAEMGSNDAAWAANRRGVTVVTGGAAS
jgi:peptidoglycan-associated lipoprotein